MAVVSLLPFQAFIMSVNEICVAKQNTFMFTRCYVADIFECDKPTARRNKQMSGTLGQQCLS
jgi:hypothetical protein